MTTREIIRNRDERGASLLFALAFVLAVGLIITAIGTIATGGFTTTFNLGQERSSEANAESAATIAIANVRYSGLVPAASTNCMPTTQQIFPAATGPGRMTVYCSGVSHSGSPTSRDVTFTVCQVGPTDTSPPAACGGQVMLLAEIVFDDLPPNAPPTADKCTPGVTPNTCGLAMTVDTWDVRYADS